MSIEAIRIGLERLLDILLSNNAPNRAPGIVVINIKRPNSA